MDVGVGESTLTRVDSERMSLVGPGEKTAASGEGFSSITSVIPRTRLVSLAGSRQRMAIGTKAASSARYGASIAMIVLPSRTARPSNICAASAGQGSCSGWRLGHGALAYKDRRRGKQRSAGQGQMRLSNGHGRFQAAGRRFPLPCRLHNHVLAEAIARSRG